MDQVFGDFLRKPSKIRVIIHGKSKFSKSRPLPRPWPGFPYRRYIAHCYPIDILNCPSRQLLDILKLGKQGIGLPTVIRTIKIHGPILLLMLAISFIAFGNLMNTPIWEEGDAQILCDAHVLSQNPGAMFGHVGFYFSQPILQLAFLLEYQLLGLDPAGYIFVNLLVHAFNAFIVYMLVNMLFPRGKIGILAGVLFAFAVGSYGKIFMNVYQLEGLLLAFFHLLVLYFFIRNDFRREGRIWSPYFLLGLFLFLITGLTKATSFSLVLTLIAYKAFFFKWRQGRAILSPDLLVFAIVGSLFYVAQTQWGYRHPTVFDTAEGFGQFTWISFKNIFRYLNLMFFPMQNSPILETAHPVVVWVYESRTLIRVFLTLSIISYSFFGFVFGSKAIRFFIAWTFITLLPFTGQTHSATWLNLSHLYLTSLGFCVILAAGTSGTSGLLAKAGWKRFAPYLVPLAFVVASIGLAHQLDSVHRDRAHSARGEALRENMIQECSRRPVRFQVVK